ncbi:MAG: Cyclophilin-like, partial [Pseudomonadota bacterium]
MLLKFDNFEIKIDLDNSETAFKLAKLSSFKAQINTWGEEIYFETK